MPRKAMITKMKFTVGYPSRRNDAFISRIIERSGQISEVYFAFGDLPNGRSRQTDTDEPSWEATTRQLADLKRISDAGIELSLLLNASCYGADSLSRAFFMKLGDTVDLLSSRYPLSSVTTTSPLIARFIHENFAGMEVRASVNMGIGTIPAMDYVSGFFDSFYLKRELNRDLEAIRRIGAWCNENGKKLLLLANSGCLNDCSAHTFHDNLVAHESELARTDNAYAFSGICREYLRSPDKRVSLIRDMNYIRPEDLHLYEGLAAAVKLATRVNKNPARLLDAYLDRHYTGAVTDLLEPDNGSAILPSLVDNSLFPADFGERVMTCDKRCESCGYCRRVLEAATVRLDGDLL